MTASFYLEGIDQTAEEVAAGAGSHRLKVTGIATTDKDGAPLVTKKGAPYLRIKLAFEDIDASPFSAFVGLPFDGQDAKDRARDLRRIKRIKKVFGEDPNAPEWNPEDYVGRVVEVAVSAKPSKRDDAVDGQLDNDVLWPKF